MAMSLKSSSPDKARAAESEALHLLALMRMVWTGRLRVGRLLGFGCVLLLFPQIATARESFGQVRERMAQRGVEVTSEHPRCSVPTVFGLYVRGRMQVVVCPKGDQRDSLLHEGWHLVQARCLKGAEYFSEPWLRDKLSRRDRRDLDALYTSKQWRREAEARYMASRPLDAYFEAFDALCKPAMPTPAAGLEIRQ
ncbi:MAG: hypothetical protein RLZZ631_1241 [Cyanobacteriota bacterium]|jgi:Asp-tRNA(Asn)/Glu-tRNA(Gln) amidotransferase A subunit family amidase